MFSWTLSYVLVFLIPILVSCVIMIRSNNVLTDELIRSNANYASQIRTSMDAVLRETISYAQTAVRSDELLEVFTGSVREKDYRVSILAATEYLAKTSAPRKAVREIYIFTQEGGIMTINNFSDPAYSENLIRRSAFPYDQYREIVQGLEKDMLVFLENEQGASLYYLCFPNLYNMKEVPGVFVLEFDADALVSYLAEKNMDNTGIIVLSSQGECVFANMDMTPEYLKVVNQAVQDGGYEFTYAGQHQAYSCLDSQVSPLRYVVVTPSTVVLSTAQNNLRLIVWGLCLTVLAGLLVIYLLLRYNYRPISSLMDDIGEAPVVYGSNEYVAIRQSIDRTRQQNKQFSDALFRHNELVCQSILTALLRGRIYYDTHGMSLKEWCASYGVHFLHEAYIVIAIGFETANRQELEAYSMERTVVLEALERCGLSKYVHYTAEMGDTIVMVLNITAEGSTDSRALLQRELNEASERCEENFGYSFYCAVSQPVIGPEQIHVAYHQADAVMDYAVTSGQTGPMYYGEEESVQTLATVGAYEEKAERQLINNIRLGRYDAVEAQLRELFFIPAGGRIPLEVQHCLIYDIAATLVRILESEKQPDAAALIRELGQCEGLSQMREALFGAARHVCGLFEMQRNYGKLSREIRGVTAYIQEHFRSEDLNVNTLADHFGFSPPYFSRLFYEQAGVRLLDYLNLQRVEAAKEMLAQNHSLQHIAEQTGLRNSGNLIRLFKKYEGITPGQYREERR